MPEHSQIMEPFSFWLILWCRKYNNDNTKEKSGWLCVGVALTGGGLLTTIRMTVRSRQRSKWRATCLPATCWSSSAWSSRQSVESHLSSQSPAGGSRAQISTLNFQRGLVWFMASTQRVYRVELSNLLHLKCTSVTDKIRYPSAWLVCCSCWRWWSCQASAGVARSHIWGTLITKWEKHNYIQSLNY